MVGTGLSLEMLETVLKYFSIYFRVILEDFIIG